MQLSAISEVRKFWRFLDAGFTNMDVSFCTTVHEDQTHDPILDGDDWLERIDSLKQELDEKGIRIVSTHLPYRYDFTNTQAEEYARKYEMTRKALIASEHLGARWAVVHIRSVEGTVSHVKKLFADTKVKICGIAIENIFNVPMENVLEAHDILKAEGYDVSVCFDFGHCHMTTHYTYEVVDTLYRLGSRIGMLHIHDNCRNGDHHRAPFAGTIDWAASMRALKDIGFKGPFNYELNLKVIPTELIHSYVGCCKDIADHLIGIYDAYTPEEKENAK